MREHPSPQEDFADVLRRSLLAEGFEPSLEQARRQPAPAWRPMPAFVTGKGQSLNLRT